LAGCWVAEMYIVVHTDEKGVRRRLLLSEAEYQASLHRAQENPGDLDPQKLREVTGEKNLNEPKRDQLNG
jgi:hypothetical protein